ncbi:hypothetical protein HNQ34_000396 [Anoxybacillus tepidamans]|uniref:DUF2642 domain-containing protein n=1 Tax=Anoxybacteroides tepidamans TaxID=265948 RepID=A0A7W8IPH1_9BACL|nr:hypothetical protein [Anoxybacillus tepidamans]MBB5323319.1 hypothetical protein [Anoxybacillus tepidamans]
MDFMQQARHLVGHNIRVITVHGTFTGTLLSVGSDFLIMRVRIAGRLRRILIRLALIIALFRLLGPISSGYERSHTSSADDDVLEQYLMDEDD